MRQLRMAGYHQSIQVFLKQMLDYHDVAVAENGNTSSKHTFFKQMLDYYNYLPKDLWYLRTAAYYHIMYKFLTYLPEYRDYI